MRARSPESRPVPAGLPDITCARAADGRAVVTGIAHHWVIHSPGGFEWGYAGSAPADLAFNILMRATLDRSFAQRHHHGFLREVVSRVPAAGGSIPAPAVREWIARRQGDAPPHGTPG